ncbi:hypothetical protein Bbelb_083530 [Branchiostoma belcheri]|nr:hypothetical protein Bbelb_083530 [Branchiostoma belcheri]
MHARVRSGVRKNAAMLFLLLFIATCTASDGPGSPQCKVAGWRVCVPLKGKMGQMKVSGTCVVCGVQIEGVAPVSPFSFLAGAQHVAIRGYPFHFLSANSLAPLEHSVVLTLALLNAKITDVKNNTLAGFSSLVQLSLDSNRLTNVKKTWFTAGLKNLRWLTLSNNYIKQIQPGSFANLTRLYGLNLENNLLQVVDPAWLFGLKGHMLMNLGLNAINSIAPGSFRHIQLYWLDLSGNDLSCLDEDVFRGQSWLGRLRVSSGTLSTVHDAKPHEMTWSLQRFFLAMRGSAVLAVVVPRFHFCVSHNRVTPGFSFWWMFDSSDSVPYNIAPTAYACGIFKSSLISIQPPVVVLAIDDSLTDKLETNSPEQCRQVWEYDGGIAMELGGSSYFRLVSLSTGNSTFEGVGMSFVQTQDTNTLTTTESGYGQTHTAITNANHDHAKNITCILLTKDKHTTLFFTTPQDQLQTHKATYSTETGHSVSLTHYTKHTEKYYPSSEMVDNSTLQASSTATSGPEVPPKIDHVLISVVAVSALVGLVLSSLLVLVLKLCSKGTSEDERDSDDAHVWTVPPGVAFPGLLRSASLPARGKMALDAVVSCRSLPVALHSVQPTYTEIPDDVACAQRPLPSLPHDDVMVRSASLPARTRGTAPDDAASCRSLPTVLQSIEPTYSEIPDHMAAAQRPLPALPRTSWEITEHGAAAQRPLPVPHHTYSEIPDDESGPMPFYTDPGGFSLHVVRNRGQNKRAFRDVTTTSNRHLSGRSMATYGSAEQNKAQGDSVYRMAIDVQGIRTRRNLRTGLLSQAIDQSVRTYVNVTDAIMSRGQEVTEAHIAFLTSPGTFGSWEISGEGTRITPRRASLPTVTLPNTYWPWEIPGEGTCNTSRRASLPTVTLPNTYWPWEIPGEGASNTPRRASLPTVTLPNTYWPWEIPGEGTRNTPRRTSLPTVTLPNTYWPWEIPGDGTRNTPQRAPLPTVTLPNTYWPWEIPGEGTRNTARRASLPTVTLPNTYWPWEIPGEGTRNTPQRAPLPTVTPPNTYWPWEIPGDGTRNTPQRAPLPTVTPPNTYWPWEIPGDGTRNTPQRAPLPTVTLPNTYWPWEIPGDGTRNTPRRASLPTVTLPNTYWPWEIPEDGTRNTT